MKTIGLLQLHKSIGLLLFLLLGVSSVSAFGVSSSYWGGHPLYVSPGETKEIAISLQNMDSDTGDISASVKMTSGAEIASLKDEGKIYNMPYGTDNTPVYIEIKIPKDAQPGQTWTLSFDIVSTSATKNQGVIQFNTGVIESFDVVVQQPETATAAQAPETKGNNMPLIIVSIILGTVLLAIIVIILAKKGSVSSNEKRRGKRK